MKQKNRVFVSTTPELQERVDRLPRSVNLSEKLRECLRRICDEEEKKLAKKEEI